MMYIGLYFLFQIFNFRGPLVYQFYYFYMLSSLNKVLLTYLLTLCVQKDNASAPSLYLRRIIRLDELGQTFLARLVMRLQYKDGHKTHYPSRQTILRNSS